MAYRLKWITVFNRGNFLMPPFLPNIGVSLINIHLYLPCVFTVSHDVRWARAIKMELENYLHDRFYIKKNPMADRFVNLLLMLVHEEYLNY